MTTHRLTYRSLAALALATVVAACNDTLSVGATGDVQVDLQKMSPAASLIGFNQQPDTAAPQRSMQPDTVASLKVTVTAVEFLRADSDTSDTSAAWTRVQLSAPVTVDLMALPSASDSSFLIASGSVAVGTYTRLRMFVSNPTIRFTGSVSFGASGTLQGGVDYAVTIPSAAQTGIKTQASVTVQASSSGATTAQVHLLFDQNSTLGNVAVTGTGTVMLSPVLHSR